MRMNQQEIDLFSETIKNSRNYLEYGAGGSTKLVTGLGTIKQIVSVESDPDYIRDHVMDAPEVRNAVENGRLQFLTPDIGPTGDWGSPLDLSKRHLWPNYAQCPYESDFIPDLILIDGRFRVACALVAAFKAPEATVLLHDANRKEYFVLKKFFLEEVKINSLIKMKRRAHFDPISARLILEKYLYQPTDKGPNSKYVYSPDTDEVTLREKFRRSLRKVKQRVLK